jgi:hypothetical protein
MNNATGGIPAIEQLLGKGTNVNVTLLFSPDAYEHVPDDQGIEQSPGGTFTKHPAYADLENRILLALESGSNAVAALFGVLGMVSRKYADKIRFILTVATRRLTTGCALIMLLGLAAAVSGCGVPWSSPDRKIIPVVSLDKIAGKWEGVSQTVPEMRDDATVMLIIREEGRFHFISNRGTELLLGSGTLTIVNKTVVAKGYQGTALLTLHDKEYGPVLVVQAALTNGHHYYIEMARRK